MSVSTEMQTIYSILILAGTLLEEHLLVSGSDEHSLG
jgi:hypothetical protein